MFSFYWKRGCHHIWRYSGLTPSGTQETLCRVQSNWGQLYASNYLHPCTISLDLFSFCRIHTQ